jgi:hypothetical protein
MIFKQPLRQLLRQQLLQEVVDAVNAERVMQRLG